MIIISINRDVINLRKEKTLKINTAKNKKSKFNITSLNVKLLLPLTTILIISFLSLSITVFYTQNSELNKMAIQINGLLSNSSKIIEKDLAKLNFNIRQKLNDMSDTTSKLLTEVTNSSLKHEKQKINNAWLNSLKENMQSLSILLSQIAGTSILSYDYTKLISYLKSANSNKNVVYAIYLKPNNKPYVRYFDQTKDKIKKYMDIGQGKKKYEKILWASQNDPDVFIIKKKISVEGKDLGYFLICVDKNNINKIMNEIALSFDTLIEKNSSAITTIFAKESLLVNNSTQKSILDVSQKNKTIMDEIESEILRFNTFVKDKVKNRIWVSGIICCFIVFLITWFLIRIFVLTPLKKSVRFAKKIAEEGDLTAQLEIDQKDIIGKLGDALMLMSKNLRNIIGEISNTTSTLSGASGKLTSISSHMTSSTEKANIQSNTVVKASEQINISIGTMASAAKQSNSSVTNIAAMTEQMSSTFKGIVDFAQTTATNVQDVASASEEISSNVNDTAIAVKDMTVSLDKVASNTVIAINVSANAKQGAKDINVKMISLVDASKKIEKIIAVIKGIADQTNMLALNATIEAAGAGEAGKGFAVVAGEVKELAKQSADATGEIASQVEEIQNSTSEVVVAIDEISKIINDIAEITETTASSVEKQTITARDISKTMDNNASIIQDIAKKSGESATYVQEIAKSTNESSGVAGEVARYVSELSVGIDEVAQASRRGSNDVQDVSSNIQAISIALDDVVKNTEQTNISSMELATLADSLSKIVAKFTI